MEGGARKAELSEEEASKLENILKILSHEKSLKVSDGKLVFSTPGGFVMSLDNAEVLEGIALRTIDMIQKTVESEENDIIPETIQLQDVVKVVVNHWRLTWRKCKDVKLCAISASLDLTGAMLVYVLSQEEKLHASAKATGLEDAIECASIVTLAIDLLVAAAGGSVRKNCLQQTGRQVASSGQDGLELMQSIFHCVGMLFGVLRTAILASTNIPSYEGGELRRLADPIGIALISIASFCSDATTYDGVISKIPKSLVAMVSLGLCLLEHPVVLPFVSQRPKTISTICCKGGVELLVARCLSLLAQVAIHTSPDFLGSLGDGKSSKQMHGVIRRLLHLFRRMLERPMLTDSSRCHGELQLQLSMFSLLIELSDRSEFRESVLKGVCPSIAFLLLGKEKNFRGRWCGGWESLLLYTRNSDNGIFIKLHSPHLDATMAKISDAVNSVRLFNERVVSKLRGLPPGMIAEAQQVVALRSILLAHLLSNLAMCAPKEAKNQFADRLVKSMVPFIKGAPLEQGTTIALANLGSLLNFLRPLESFPLHDPIIGANVFKSIELLGYTLHRISQSAADPVRRQLSQNHPMEVGRDEQQGNIDMIVLDESEDRDEDCLDTGATQTSRACDAAVNSDRGAPPEISARDVSGSKNNDRENVNNVPQSYPMLAHKQSGPSAGMREGSEKDETRSCCQGGQQMPPGNVAPMDHGTRCDPVQSGSRSGMQQMSKHSLKRGGEANARLVGDVAGSCDQQGEVVQASRSAALRQSYRANPHLLVQGMVPRMPYSVGMTGNVNRGTGVGNTFLGHLMGRTGAPVPSLPRPYFHPLDGIVRGSPAQVIPTQSRAALYTHNAMGHLRIPNGIRVPAWRECFPQLQQRIGVVTAQLGVPTSNTQYQGIPEIRSTPAPARDDHRGGQQRV